jgi:hypothetical protein
MALAAAMFEMGCLPPLLRLSLASVDDLGGKRKTHLFPQSFVALPTHETPCLTIVPRASQTNLVGESIVWP